MDGSLAFSAQFWLPPLLPLPSIAIAFVASHCANKKMDCMFGLNGMEVNERRHVILLNQAASGTVMAMAAIEPINLQQTIKLHH